MTFNWFHYRELNSDLVTHGLITETDCTNHYNNFGKNENRKINIYDEYSDFNWEQYRRNYKDLLILSSKEELENHWLQFGRYENRIYTNLLYRDYPDFNWEQYRLNYIDLATNLSTKEECENHWFYFGEGEGRSYYVTKRINNKEDWRSFCKNNMNYLNILNIMTQDCNPRINAVLVEFRILENLEFVIRNTIIKLKNKCSYTVVCGNLNFDYITSINSHLDNILIIIKLDYDNIDINQYSKILTSLSFWENLTGDYILIYQEDSCIFKDNIEDYLCFDYIGAPWPKTQNDNKNLVGNGGLSLRNKQKMIQVIQKINPLEMTFNSSTLEYMINCKITFPPEDVYFTKAMLDYNIGTVADWESASNFSTESCFNIDSFGGHQFWISGNALELLYSRVIIKFKPIYKLDYEHRGGWNSVLTNLINNNFYSDDSLYYFFDIIESYFLWRTDYSINKKWCGIIHLTSNIPEYLNTNYDIENIFNNPNFIKSLKYCFVLFTLSEYIKKLVMKNLIRLNININVIALKHPIDNNVLMFNIDNYKNNNYKTIIQIGQQLRIMSSIYRINIKNHSRMWLTGTKNIEHVNKMLETEIKSLQLDISISNVQMTYIDNIDLYDILLSKNIVFIHLIDASANNTIIECIIRNTPIVVNKLDAVVEYLGENYPLYFNNLNELKDIITFENINKAYNYLVSMDKTDLTFKYFNYKLYNSIYENI